MIAVLALLLTGCGGSGTDKADEDALTGGAPENGPTEAHQVDLAGVCERLVELSAMPHDDESEYVNAADPPGDNSLRCSIEPSDWGEAAALGEAGRGVLQLQLLDEENLDLQPGEEYESGRSAGDYQTEEFDEPVHGEPAAWPDSMDDDEAERFTGHRYEYRFEAKLTGIWTRHEILFLVPGSDGSETDHYRTIAFEVFETYMADLAAELE